MIMVIGCTGYIGSKLCMEFVEEGQQVLGICLDCNTYAAQKLKNAGVIICEVDITKNDMLKQRVRVEDIQVVYQMAGVHGTLKRMQEVYITGIKNVIHLFKGMTPYFVFASSGVLNSSNTDDKHIVHPLRPITAQMEQLIISMCSHAAIIRLAEVYGTEQMNPFQYINTGISMIGDGNNICAKVYIDDVINVLKKLYDTRLDGTFELCDDLNVTQRDFYSYVEYLTKCKFVKWIEFENMFEETRLWQSIHGLRTLEIHMNNEKIKDVLQYTMKFPDYKCGLSYLYNQQES